MSNRKRKASNANTNRIFQERWTYDYFFVDVENKPICLICNQPVSEFKEYNIKRHYVSRHSSAYEKYQNEFRQDKVKELTKVLRGQQMVLSKVSLQQESVVKASYLVAEIIAKKSKPFADGEFMKECIVRVADVICPEKKETFAKISLSRQTITRRVEELGNSIEETLIAKARKFSSYSLALDESTDVRSTAQLAFFVRGVDDDFEVTEELAAIVPMKGTTRGIDLLEAVMKTIKRVGLPLSKLSGITTDGAPSMAGRQQGLANLLQLEASKVGNDTVMQFHCIIHQENLCAKSVKMQNVMSVVTKTVNFIRSKGLRHREFQELLHSMDADFDDIPYYTEVRWLSRGKMLKRMFESKDAIQTFMESKGNGVDEFMNEEWIEDFAFLVDITTHLNELNSRLQRKGQLIHSVFDHVNGFAMKLTLWETQIYNKNFVNFPSLQSLQVQNSQKYAKVITELRNDFDHRFADFKKSAMHFNVFSCPFSVKIEEVPENLQMECIDLQCSSDLREKFKDFPLLEFYKKYVSKEKYQRIHRLAVFVTSLFVSTYLYEQVFSRMNHVKSPVRSLLSDSHVENSLRIATSSILPNIAKLVREKQCQTSH